MGMHVDDEPEMGDVIGSLSLGATRTFRIKHNRTKETMSFPVGNPITSKRFLNRTWEFIFRFTKTGKVPLDRLAVGVPYDDARNASRTGSSVRCGGDVWFIPYETVHGNEDRGNHPATFPIEVAERCIKLAGIKPGMKVLDPFCGVNGMAAAVRLGVDGIGIDVDPAFCKTARKQILYSVETGETDESEQ